MSLITGTTTFGDVFSVGINGYITSQIFIEYENKISIAFCKEKLEFFYKIV